MRLRSGMSPNVPRFWRQTVSASPASASRKSTRRIRKRIPVTSLPPWPAAVSGGRDEADDAEIAPERVAQRHMPLPVMKARVPSPAMTKAMIENCSRLRRLSAVRAE